MLPTAHRAAQSTVASLFAQLARHRASATALVDRTAGGPLTLTYGELGGRVQRLAALLQARGVGPGDRVALLSRNRAEYLEVFLASAWIGAVVACQNWRLADAELAHCLDLVEPTLLLASTEQGPRLADREEPRAGKDGALTDLINRQDNAVRWRDQSRATRGVDLGGRKLTASSWRAGLATSSATGGHARGVTQTPNVLCRAHLCWPIAAMLHGPTRSVIDVRPEAASSCRGRST